MNKKKRKLKRLATKAFKYGYVADNFDTYISMQQGTDIEMERMKKSLAGIIAASIKNRSDNARKR